MTAWLMVPRRYRQSPRIRHQSQGMNAAQPGRRLLNSTRQNGSWAFRERGIKTQGEDRLPPILDSQIAGRCTSILQSSADRDSPVKLLY